MSSKGYDIVMVGAGIVGLATAYRLLLRKPELKLCILEKEEEIARHQSGNNSGVLHSGIYYAPGSLKALNCIRGYNMMLEYCYRENIPFDICGKIIMATSEAELPQLYHIYQRGVANGLQGLHLLDPEEIREREPHAVGIKAILVPQAGIVDYKAVCHSLAVNVRNMGGVIRTGVQVEDINESAAQVEVVTAGEVITGSVLVAAAGLYADVLAGYCIPDPGVQIIPFRGEYYRLRPEKENLVKHLIYPVPDPNFPFLGVHFTRMIDGGVEAGPNAVLAFAREGYRKRDVNIRELLEIFAYPGFRKIALRYWKTGMRELYRSYSRAAFASALQKLVPEVCADDLLIGGAGVRAQACDRNGKLLDDFFFLRTARTLHICNAPSPAATSSLSIGESIVDELEENYLR